MDCWVEGERVVGGSLLLEGVVWKREGWLESGMV